MTTTRRDFLSLSLAAGAAAAFAKLPRARADYRYLRADTKPQKILILGGTSFVGPACIDAALARGHKVTIFNRGVHEEKRKEAGRPSVVPEGVEVLYGNRDPEKTADDWKKKPEDGPKDPNSPKGLSQLEGKKWDAVIDTSGYFPRIVRASAELLAPNIRQYIFISSISVYKNNDKPNEDESGELSQLDDPKTEDFGPGFKNYGGGKTACEAAAEKAMPGRVANVRPGFIVGPRDTTARFIYWPLRTEKGGEMAVPGSPSDPLQIIDVRDLGEWLVHLIETNTNGVFNATGPDKPLTFGSTLEACKRVTKADTTFTYIDPKFLEEKHIEAENTFPLWLPPVGESAGFHQRSIAKAVAAGLKFRPVDDTVKGTLDWYHALPPDIQKQVAHLMAPADEQALLKAWHEKSEKK